MKKQWNTSIMRYLGLILLGIVGFLGMTFSAINTFSLFQGIFGYSPQGVLASVAGLALFDIGLIGWVVFAVSSATGVFQRIVSWGAAALCLILTFVAAGTEVILTQTLTTKPEWIGAAALVAILSGLVVNITGIALIHVSDPESLRQMKDGMLKDQIASEVDDLADGIRVRALAQAREQVDQISDDIARRLGAEIKGDVMKALLNATPGGANQIAPPTLSAPIPQRTPWQVVNPATAMGGGYTPPQAPRSPFPQNHGASHKSGAPAPRAVETMEVWEEDDQTLQNAELAPKGAPRVTGTRHNLSSSPTHMVRPVPTMDEVRRRMSE